MLSYQDHVNKIRELQRVTQESITELENKVLKDLEDELSKYLKVVNVEDVTIEKERNFQLVKHQPDKIFLVSDDYGCILSLNRENVIYPTVSVYAVYKDNNKYKYVQYAQNVFYTYQTENLEKEVKTIVDKLKRKNNYRILRKLKSATKKYNL